jgi:NADH:ubiquinone oxidoreductase subunit D
MARGAGLKKDVRLSIKNSYSGYNSLLLRSFIGVNGDCYDRYLIRMLEMGESLNICNTIITKLVKNHNSENYVYQKFINNSKKLKKREYYFMEDVINHFIN